MEELIQDEIFYNPNNLFSYDAIFSFCMGERGAGKTWAGKEKMIKLWTKKKKQSVYVRRTVTELDKVKDTLFNDIQKKYTDIEITVKGYQAFIDGECFCYFIPLSTSSQYKSASFPDVEFIFFDEYVLKKTGHNDYIKNEMELLHELVFTVFRLRKPTVYLCSNAVSYVNPFFESFNIEPKPSDHFIKIKNKYGYIDVVVELTQKSKYREVLKKSRYAMMLEGTSYGSYAIDNNTLEDTNDFIVKKKPSDFNYFRGAYRVGNKIISAWSVRNADSGVWFGTDKYDPNSKWKYTVYSKENYEGWRNIKIDRDNFNIKYIKKCFLDGKCYYEKQDVKKLFIEQVSRFL